MPIYSDDVNDGDAAARCNAMVVYARKLVVYCIRLVW